MHRLTAMLRNPLRLIGSGFGFRERLIAAWNPARTFRRRLADPRNPLRSRLGKAHQAAEPVGDALVVQISEVCHPEPCEGSKRMRACPWILRTAQDDRSRE